MALLESGSEAAAVFAEFQGASSAAALQGAGENPVLPAWRYPPGRLPLRPRNREDRGLSRQGREAAEVIHRRV